MPQIDTTFQSHSFQIPLIWKLDDLKYDHQTILRSQISEERYKPNH